MSPDAPILLVFVGPNGAGKSTLRNLLFADFSIPFINADNLAAELGIGAYKAAEVAEELRRDLVQRKKSFSFETVLSDPVGAKVAFLLETRRSGYRVMVHFIGLDSAERSRVRVFQRVTEGGHDVPDDKIAGRYPRVLENLRRLLGAVDELVIYDNSSSETPYRVIARFESEKLLTLAEDLPAWTESLDLPSQVDDGTVRLP